MVHLILKIVSAYYIKTKENICILLSLSLELLPYNFVSFNFESFARLHSLQIEQKRHQTKMLIFIRSHFNAFNSQKCLPIAVVLIKR